MNNLLLKIDKRFKYNVLVFLFILLATSCIKVEIGPIEHSEKNNIMKAKINNIEFVPCRKGMFDHPDIECYYDTSTLKLELYFYNSSLCDDLGSIWLQLEKVESKGVFALDSINYAKFQCYINEIEGIYTTNNQYNGTIEVTKFDIENGSISAIFSFNAININNEKTISITEGILQNVEFYIKK